MFGLETFKAGTLGQRVRAIVEDDVLVRDMIALSKHDIPAAQAVGKALLALGPAVKEDYVKKTIGRWIREIMSKQGWTPSKSGRVAPGNLFSSGMIYKPKA
jgi:hypothetical protein